MTNPIEKIKNIAIVAHVDHGKTTLIDKILLQTNTNVSKSNVQERILDSNKLEQERGITIFAKHASVMWKGYLINLIDTPGHADFGGEVERVLSMADGFLLLVDASEGPMPQTRFVTQKALEKGLKPLVIINKVDRESRRVEWVLDKTLELFMDLDADESSLDFPTVYTSALKGLSGLDYNNLEEGFRPLLDSIIDNVPSPKVEPNEPLQLQISQLEYNNYTGSIGIGLISKGSIKLYQQVSTITQENNEQKVRSGRIESLMIQEGLSRKPVESATAGHIVAIAGLGNLKISDTICEPQCLQPLPLLRVDEPTVSILLSVNDSPFFGKEGKLLTSRQILDRLKAEKSHNVALHFEQTNNSDTFLVSGRGELHLSILLETMRREGFEISVSKPKVIFKHTSNGIEEPFEELIIEIPESSQGTIMSSIGERRGILQDITQESAGRVKLKYIIPSRGLLGFRNQFLTLSSGGGVIYSTFLKYDKKEGEVSSRNHGVLISNGTGKALAYALFNLQSRGKLIINPGTEVYEGQVVGLHSRDNDLTVNCLQNKKLSNVRAAGKDTAIVLSPPIQFTLEQALEFIEDDELVEITPKSIRIRKKYLTEADRKRFRRDI